MEKISWTECVRNEEVLEQSRRREISYKKIEVLEESRRRGISYQKNRRLTGFVTACVEIAF
jgi:hypothetical protein